jgi:hypothetical protein
MQIAKDSEHLRHGMMYGRVTLKTLSLWKDATENIKCDTYGSYIRLRPLSALFTDNMATTA